MTYYEEQLDGARKVINDWTYEARVRLEGWYHVLREEKVTIIKKGK